MTAFSDLAGLATPRHRVLAIQQWVADKFRQVRMADRTMGGYWQASILSRRIDGLGASPPGRRIKPLERQTRDAVLPVKRLGPLPSRLLSLVAEVRQTASSNLLIILISFGASVLAARLLGPSSAGR